MHITCETTALLQGVTAVERAVANSEAEHNLSGIFLEAADGIVTLVATDREIGIEKVVTADVLRPGSCIIDGRLLSGIVRKLSGSDCSIQLEENGQAVIKSGAARFSVQTRRTDDFPRLPSPSDMKVWRILQPEMRRMISYTSFAVAREDNRAYLTGSLLEVEGSEIKLVATDANRLAVRSGRLAKEADAPVSVIVPGKSLSELLRLLHGGPEDELAVGVAENQIIFTMPGLKFVSRLIDGQFPDYRRVFPPRYNVKFIVERSTFLDAVDRATLMARKGPPAVRLNVQNNVLVLTATEAEVGQLYEEIPVTQEGEDLEMVYQARFLSDVLRVIEQPNVVIEMGADMLPAVIYGEGDDAYRYVVMPVRVG